jgi:hypothetical protein
LKSSLLVASLFLNVALAGALLWLLRSQLAEPAQVPLTVAVQTSSAAGFRWSQLESEDYPTYISNLRGIGCPEQTIREIITADLDDLFAPRRQPLLFRLGSSTASAPERKEAETRLRSLRQEEAALLRELFGLPEVTNAVGAASTPGQRPLRAPHPEIESTNVEMPLVFQAVDTNRITLSAEDIQTIDRVRQSFLADLGTNRDVSSPEYLHRWQKAQLQADNLLDAMLGRQALLQYQQAVQPGNTAAN